MSLDVSERGPEPTPARNLAPAIRASLNAKLERLLERPIIAAIGDAPVIDDAQPDADAPSDVFGLLQRSASAFAPARSASRSAPAWREDPDDGTCAVKIAIDYDDLWRGREKEIVEAVENMIEGHVTFLTEEQRRLLERSPREFLALDPRPEVAELVVYKKENVGGSQRVVELTVAEAPQGRGSLRHVAIVPNLVQLERQLAGLSAIEGGADDGPLAPLRVLVGLSEARCLPASPADGQEGAIDGPFPDERLDEFQSECIRKALTTPHFAVIQGPPGSGKTTVITGIIRRSLARGERVLVVSPTHVAVDNVVEKLVPRHGDAHDVLDPRSLPVRYAARTKKLSARALEYWIGKKRQLRGAAIARRIEQRLSETVPFAARLFAIENKKSSGRAPISLAVAAVHDVICGTPIGILSYEPVGLAEPGSFDLLLVDEVSKMTLPEFLAIAVKARRWVLVGDPEQLPPFNNCEENAATLDDILDPQLELVCSVGALLEKVHPAARREERFLVLSSDPVRTAAAIQRHLAEVKPDNLPPITTLQDARGDGIIVCRPEERDEAFTRLSPVRRSDRTHAPDRDGSLRVLAQRGLRVERPAVASGMRLVEARYRAQAMLFENCFNVYHAQPWSLRAGQKLRLLTFRNGIRSYLPTDAVIEALQTTPEAQLPSARVRSRLIDAIAERYAVNAISVYDWLTGIPADRFDTTPLRELASVSQPALWAAVKPFVGTLKKQYRMHPSLSVVPRELFYFGEALIDGRDENAGGCRVSLVQVEAEGNGESNPREVDVIFRMLGNLNGAEVARSRGPSIMLITPYSQQETLLGETIKKLRLQGLLDNLVVEASTLDRCQGREADFVFVSLVRNRATPFFDMPKRWNVALTRAMKGLFLVGDIDAYLREAADARSDRRAFERAVDGRPRPLMSLLARIIEAYDGQIAEDSRRQSRAATM